MQNSKTQLHDKTPRSRAPTAPYPATRLKHSHLGISINKHAIKVRDVHCCIEFDVLRTPKSPNISSIRRPAPMQYPPVLPTATSTDIHCCHHVFTPHPPKTTRTHPLRNLRPGALVPLRLHLPQPSHPRPPHRPAPPTNLHQSHHINLEHPYHRRPALHLTTLFPARGNGR